MKTSLAFVLLILMAVTACDELDIRQPGLLIPKTVDQDSSLPSIKVNGTQLHSEAIGNPSDPMVVVLHGGPGTDYRHLLNCRELANKGYYVVFYDQRGSGLSRRESKSSYSIQIMLDDLGAVIEHYRSAPAQKVILLGHSWGAMLATAYINEYPSRINGAILCEPGGFVWKDITDYISRTQHLEVTSEALNDIMYQDQFITGKQSDQTVLDYKWGLAANSSGSKEGPLGDEAIVPFWRWGVVVHHTVFDLAKREQPDWTANLSSYNTKVLFVYSENNRAYGPDHARLVSSAYPNVQLTRIDGAGHHMLTFSTGWSTFLPLATNYLNEIIK